MTPRPQTPPLPKTRHRALDAVRGFAVILVAFYHVAFRFPPELSDHIARTIRAVGWIGVDMFFALSGFLIVAILSKNSNRTNIRLYFWKRFLRIVPIFALSIAVFYLGSIATSDTETLHLLPLTALFLNGWMIPFLGEEAVPFTITWSLSIEVFAYVVLGLAAKYSGKALFKVVWAFIAIALATRFAVYIFRPFDLIGLYYFVPSRLDAIAYGGLGAMGLYAPLIHSRLAPLFWGSLTIVTIIGFRWLMPHPEILHTIGYAWFGLVVAIWITSLFHHPDTSNSILARALEPIGKYSYFIYLFHLFFAQVLLIIQGKFLTVDIPFWYAAGLTLLLVTLAGWLSWKYIEEPLISKGNNLPKSLAKR